MMPGRRITAIVALAVFSAATHLPAQQPQGDATAVPLRSGARLAVLDIENRTTDASWTRLAAQMTSALRLTLELSRRYLLVDQREAGTADLAGLVSRLQVEAVVTGRITNAPGGRLELQIDGLNTVTNEALFTIRRESFGEFDLIAAADEVVLQAAELLLGYPVDFGVVLIEPSVGGVDYRVDLGGVEVGDRIAAIARVPSGRHLIEIFVATPFGPRIAHSREYNVAPREAVTVAFDVPAAAVGGDTEVDSRLAIAEALIGQVDRFATATRALEEVRTYVGSALDEETADRLERLERVWRDDSRYAALRPRRFAPDSESVPPAPPAAGPGDDARVERTLIAYCEMARLRWMAYLLAGDFATADTVMQERSVCDSVTAADTSVVLAGDRAFAEDLNAVAASLAARAGRPWPWLLVGGSVAAGGYAGAVALGLVALPAEIPASSDWVPREYREYTPWLPVGFAALVAVGSTIRGIRNRRVAPAYVARTARREMPELAARSEAAFARDGTDEVSVVLVGGRDTVVRYGGQALTLPAVVRATPGVPLPAAGPLLVPADQYRLVPDEGAVFVFR